ncbi:MAG: DNA-processing protein DprA [Bacteroidetes bacterium]|nr:DNA-processing protein DprA [Bacteroidota bacterium]
MLEESEILSLIAIGLIPGIGPRKARKIIELSGSASEFFRSAEKLNLAGVRTEELRQNHLKAYLRKAEDELKYNQRHGITSLHFKQKEFPFRLKSCEDGPLVIFTRGNLDLNASRIVSIVGTRTATDYGERVCEELVSELAELRCALVSGLAHGIDSFAHRAAQSRGIQNIGVVAHGLDALYPPGNRSLARSMEENGGIVTDFMIATRPDRENFPKRNRIIAGLCDATIVVEAAKKGGALITAELALSYNRDVFAVPGRIGDLTSQGCNMLIKNNRAALLNSASDLAWYMGWEKKSRKPVQVSLFETLSESETRVVSLIKNGKNHPDLILANSGFSSSAIAGILLDLEFKGIIRAMPGKTYIVIS